MLSLVILAAACSGGAEERSDQKPSSVAAQVASYEPVAGREQRFMVGLSANDGDLIGFGEVAFEFTPLDAGDEAVEPVTARAAYILVAGQVPPEDLTGPRRIAPSEGVGVYATRVTLDRPGFWEVRVVGSLDGAELVTEASFEVYDQPFNPFPGDDAPRTVQLLAGDARARPGAIDSRADEDGTVPDPELHAVTVADAIAAARPVMVVVSTPVYCVSRFCGPITDTVQQLQARYGDRMAFVHLEVWADFDNQVIGAAAAEWILREGAEGAEPWVFLVGADGKVVERWDNVASDLELEAAIEAVLA